MSASRNFLVFFLLSLCSFVPFKALALSDVSIQIYPATAAKDSPLTVKISRESIDTPWSFNHRGQNISIIVDKEKSLDSSLKPLVGKVGFAFQVDQLSFRVLWDGSVYLKQESGSFSRSLSLQVPGKVIFSDGIFQEKVKIRSKSLEFQRKVVFKDLQWKGLYYSLTPPLVTIAKHSHVEIHSLDMEGRLLNYGLLQIKDRGQVSAPSLDNHGIIQGSHFDLNVTGMLNNTKGKILGEYLNFHLSKLNNDRGLIESSNSLHLAVTEHFESFGGTLQGGNVSIFLPEQATIRDLGTIRGASEIALHARDSLNVEKGTLIAQNQVYVFFPFQSQTGNVKWNQVLVQASSLYIDNTKDLQIGDQPYLENLYLSIPFKEGDPTQIFPITHPLKIKGALHIVPADIPVRKSLAEKTWTASKAWGLVAQAMSYLPEMKHTLKIQANIHAEGGISILSPHTRLQIGEQGKEAEPVLLQTEGALQVYVSAMDLENGVIAAQSSFVRAPRGITIGRLIRDPHRDAIATAGGHGQDAYSLNLGCCIKNATYSSRGMEFSEVYDGHHLFAVPIFIPNGSSFLTKQSAQLVGPLTHHGVLRAGSLTLESLEDMVLEASTIEVEGNFHFKSPSGKLVLRRIFGTLSFNHYNHDLYWENRQWSMVSSDPSELRVGGTLTTGERSAILNEGCRLHLHKKAPHVRINSTDSSASHFQRFSEKESDYYKRPTEQIPYGRPIGEIRGDFEPFVYDEIIDSGICYYLDPVNPTIPIADIYEDYSELDAARFLREFSGFMDSQKTFPPETSFGSDVILPARETELQGRLAAPLIFINLEGGKLALGSPNIYYVPKKPLVQDLATASINAHTTHVASLDELKQVPDISLRTERFLFKFREKFWFDSEKAQNFYEEIIDYVAVQKSPGFSKLDDPSVIFALSPEYLVAAVRRSCQDTLGRGFIYPDRPIDEEFVQELHRNMSEYLVGLSIKGMNPSAFNLAIITPESKINSSLLPNKPVIFYTSLVGESGRPELQPKIFYPPEMVEQSRGERGGKILVNILGIFPSKAEGFSREQLVHYFRNNEPLQKRVKALLDKHPELLKNEGNEEESKEVSSPTAVTLDGDIEVEDFVAMASGDITSHAALKSKKAMLMSLFGNITMESTSTRSTITGDLPPVYEGADYADSILKQAKIEADAIMLIAGQDVRFIGAETRSKLNTHIEALGSILDIPVSLVRQTVKRVFDRGRGTETTRHTRQHVSSHQSQGKIAKVAGENIIGHGDQNKSDESIRLAAGKRVEQNEVHDRHEMTGEYSGDRGGLFGGTWKSQTYSYSTRSKGSTLDAPAVEIQAGKEGVTLVNPSLLSERTTINTPEGSVRINHGTEESFTATSSSRSNMAWQSSKTTTEHHVTHVPPTVTGKVEICSRETLVQISTEESKAILQKLYQSEGQLTTEQIHDIHVSTSKRVQGPSVALTALVALGVGIASAGYGASFAVNTMGLLAGGCAQAMVAAAISAASTQIALGTLCHDGDLGAGFKDLCSQKGLRSVGASVATAGVTNGLAQQMGLSQTPKGLEEHSQNAALKASVKTTVDTTVGGQTFGSALKGAAQGACVDSLGAAAAERLAHLDGVLHKLGHGVVGAGVGVVLSPEDPANGAASGALGAMAAEFFAEALSEGEDSLAKQIFEEAEEKGILHTPQSFNEALKEKLYASANWGKFLGAATTFFAGLDVEVGGAAAKNAIDHNFLSLSKEGAQKALAASKEYEFYKALKHEGEKAALSLLGIQTIDHEHPSTGESEAYYLFEGRVYFHLADALKSVVISYPDLKFLLATDFFTGLAASSVDEASLKETSDVCRPLEGRVITGQEFKEKYVRNGYLYHGARGTDQDQLSLLTRCFGDLPDQPTSRGERAHLRLIRNGIDYERLREEKSGGLNTYGSGFYMTPDLHEAKNYGEHIVPFEVLDTARVLVMDTRHRKGDRPKLNQMCGINMVMDRYPIVIAPGAVKVPDDLRNAQRSQIPELIEKYTQQQYHALRKIFPLFP